MDRHSWLEARVPPPLVALGTAGVASLLASWTPEWSLVGWREEQGALSAGLATLGLAIAATGVYEFRRRRTTVNPLRPDTASSLVDSGIYRWTRNPMYLGMLVALNGWAVWLGNPWALAVTQAFVPYISRFQIAPEERALESVFGAPYIDYKSRAGRWFGRLT